MEEKIDIASLGALGTGAMIAVGVDRSADYFLENYPRAREMARIMGYATAANVLNAGTDAWIKIAEGLGRSGGQDVLTMKPETERSYTSGASVLEQIVHGVESNFQDTIENMREGIVNLVNGNGIHDAKSFVSMALIGIIGYPIVRAVYRGVKSYIENVNKKTQ